MAFTGFKYVSAKRAEHCLDEGTLYLARPDELNDALEAQFTSGSAEEYLATIEATIADVARQRGESPMSFPRDVLPEFAAVHRRENHHLQAFCEHIGICSLASRPNHQAMWAHYSGGGEGICLELRLSREVLEAHELLYGPVTYSDAPRAINRAEDWGATFQELAAQYPNASVQDLLPVTLEESFRRRMGLHMAQRATSVKHPDWAHEDEIRLLGPKGQKPLPILDEVLTQVHFLGTKGICRVAPLLVRQYPSVNLVQWTFSHGELQTQAQPMQIKMVPVDG